MSDINLIFQKLPNRNPFIQLKPIIVCKDGFSISIQAGESLHSNPRKDNESFYNSYEICLFGELEPIFTEYLSDGIGSYVPFALINHVLESHGGVIGYKDLNDNLVKIKQSRKIKP